MSLAKMNIWIRFEDCRLISNLWRVDLVIKTCGGDYLLDMYPDVIAQLQQRYPDTTVSIIRNYCGADRIRIESLLTDSIPKKIIKPHIEVDVPPGCYIVWARLYFYMNVESHKTMVIVRCDDEACVNLIYPSIKTLARDGIQAFAARAKELDLPDNEIEIAANVLAKVADQPLESVANEARMRLAELKDLKDIEGAQNYKSAAELLSRLRPIETKTKRD